MGIPFIKTRLDQYYEKISGGIVAQLLGPDFINEINQESDNNNNNVNLEMNSSSNLNNKYKVNNNNNIQYEYFFKEKKTLDKSIILIILLYINIYRST